MISKVVLKVPTVLKAPMALKVPQDQIHPEELENDIACSAQFSIYDERN